MITYFTTPSIKIYKKKFRDYKIMCIYRVNGADKSGNCGKNIKSICM
jgi:hypothetical protein